MRSEIAAIVRQALEEIGMTFADAAQFENTAIARILQQLKDVGGSEWNPSPRMLAGLIFMLFLEKKNYPRNFDEDWFAQNQNKTVGDLIVHLNRFQVQLD